MGWATLGHASLLTFLGCKLQVPSPRRSRSFVFQYQQRQIRSSTTVFAQNDAKTRRTGLIEKPCFGGWTSVQHFFPNEGVTSVSFLLPQKSDHAPEVKVERTRNLTQKIPLSLFVGGKRGSVMVQPFKLHIFPQETKPLVNFEEDACPLLEVSAKGQNSKIPSKPPSRYPVFSMDCFTTLRTKTSKFPSKRDSSTSGQEDQIIYVACGGGDRYVTLWEKNETQSQSNDGWNIVARLGPHTGWVKDVLVLRNASCNASNIVMYSIGCNFVETWLFDSKNETWTRGLPRSVTSLAPQDRKQNDQIQNTTPTLSSDLLCLCHISPDPFSICRNDTSFLAAGGVDGRIHLWPQNEVADSYITHVVHQGRINQMLWSHTSNLLFTCSHDGSVSCVHLHLSSLRTEGKLMWGSTAQWSIPRCYHFQQEKEEEDDDEERILSMALLSQEVHCVHLAVGTSQGNVYRLKATRLVDDSSVTVTCQNKMPVKLGAVIHAMNALHVPVSATNNMPNEGEAVVVLAVGHARGLCLLS